MPQFSHTQAVFNPQSRPATVRNLRQAQLECPAKGVLINAEVRLAVIQVLLAQDSLQSLNVTYRGQSSGSQRAPSTMRATGLYSRRITCWSA